MARARAGSFSSGATASSRSRIITSAASPRAFSSARRFAAGTKSADRRDLSAFDKDELALADTLADLAGRCVFRRVVAGERIFHRGELDDHIAGARLALQHLGL